MKNILLAVGFSLITIYTVFAQPAVTFQPVVSGLTQPTDVVAPPDNTNRLFITQKGGTIRVLNGGALLADTFLNISHMVTTNSERGLLSIAFHPNHTTN